MTGHVSVIIDRLCREDGNVSIGTVIDAVCRAWLLCSTQPQPPDSDVEDIARRLLDENVQRPRRAVLG